MKKTLLFSLLAFSGLTVSAQQSVIPDDEATVYGFMPFDFERYPYTHSFIKFSTNKPNESDFTKIGDFDTRKGLEYPEITAGTMVGDEYWAYCKAPYDLLYWESLGLYRINLENGTYSLINNCNWLQDRNILYPMDMSYDPTTGLIWYVAPITTDPIRFLGFGQEGTTGWALCSINPKDHSPYPLQFGPDLPACVSCVAADHGKLYGLSISYNRQQTSTVTSLVEIVPDLSTQNYTFNTIRTYQANELQVSAPLDWSSMEWDRTNHRLYATYSSLTDGQVYFVELDPATGEILSTEKQGHQIMVNALAMPYQTCPDDAPFYVGNLTVTTGQMGDPLASLTWELPTQTYMKQPLMELNGIRVWRDDVLVAELSADATSFAEQGVPFGLHEYKVRAYNSVGEGLYASRSAFVGKDTPGMPQDLTFCAKGSTAKLSWRQPETGAHGAWFDTSSITYKVTRHPDETIVAEALTECLLEDEVSVTEGYSYTITACNHEGEGLSVTTGVLSFGPSEALPFFSDLKQESEFNKWTVYDVNHDGYTWVYSQEFLATVYDATFCGNRPDDLLFSPVIDTQQGERYKLTYEVKVHNYEDTEEKFEWYAGPSDATPSTKGTRFENGSYDSSHSLKWYTRQGIFDGHEGGTRISFNVCSDPLQGILYLGRVTVRLYSDLDLAVTNITGSEMVGEGRETPILVTLKNEGKSTVSHYKIKLTDQMSDEVTIQEFSDPIGSEEELTCRVMWSSSEQGPHFLNAEVILEGDTYPEDNALEAYHEIIVTEGSDQAWKTVGQYMVNDPNWCGINYTYTQSQAIYLAEELDLEPGTQIIGIGFAYEGNDELETMTMVNFEVGMGNTNLDQIYDFHKYATDWNYYPKLLANKYFTDTPFAGFADMSAPSGEVGHLTFDFDQPFTYDGRNLAIRVERTVSSKLFDGFVHFHFDVLDPTEMGDQNPKARAVYYEGQSKPSGTPKAKGHGLNQLPILYLGYDTSAGIRGVKTLGSKLTTDAHNGLLELSQPCLSATLTDLSGRILYSGTNVQQIDVRHLTSPIAVLTATLEDGTTTTVKVRVK